VGGNSSDFGFFLVVMTSGSHEWWVCWLFLLGRRERRIEKERERDVRGNKKELKKNKEIIFR